jgi:hypothetical protein
LQLLCDERMWNWTSTFIFCLKRRVSQLETWAT